MLKASIKFLDRSAALEKGIGKFVTRAVGKSVKLMERNIKVNTPVREGHLKRSIRSQHERFEGEVFTMPVEGGVEVDYAVHVEYGTVHQAPRAMFRKGAGQSQKGIKKIFAEEAKKVSDKARGK